jgi:hypothetical protein
MVLLLVAGCDNQIYEMQFLFFSLVIREVLYCNVVGVCNTIVTFAAPVDVNVFTRLILRSFPLVVPLPRIIDAFHSSTVVHKHIVLLAQGLCSLLRSSHSWGVHVET